MLGFALGTRKGMLLNSGGKAIRRGAQTRKEAKTCRWWREGGRGGAGLTGLGRLGNSCGGPLGIPTAARARAGEAQSELEGARVFQFPPPSHAHTSQELCVPAYLTHNLFGNFPDSGQEALSIPTILALGARDLPLGNARLALRAALLLALSSACGRGARRAKGESPKPRRELLSTSSYPYFYYAYYA